MWFIGLPQPFYGRDKLEKLKNDGIIIRPELHDYFTTQYAGDMQVRFDSLNFTLLQIWKRFYSSTREHDRTSCDTKRLKLTPTLFIGTTASENDIIFLYVIFQVK